MTRGEGACRINAVRVGEVNINNLGPYPTVAAKLTLVSSADGHGHGFTNRNVWSPKTMEALHAFLLALEAEVVQSLFPDTAHTPPLAEPTEADPSDGVPSL